MPPGPLALYLIGGDHGTAGECEAELRCSIAVTTKRRVLCVFPRYTPSFGTFPDRALSRNLGGLPPAVLARHPLCSAAGQDRGRIRHQLRCLPSPRVHPRGIARRTE